MSAMRPEAVVNIDDYPITEAENPARARLVERLAAELSANQYCSLPGFIRPAALARVVAEANAARPLAYHNMARRNCYLQRTTDADFPENHPRNRLFDTSTRMIAYDQIPGDSPIKTLYHWPHTLRMVADIVGADALYANEDPYQPVNLLCYEQGDRSSWHFDSVNAFTMTLMLQAPEAGGVFEIVPNKRSDTDQNHDYLGKVLAGARPGDAVQVAREPGALCIFRGCNSLHRVSPVTGGRMRIMAVFVYETEPGVLGDREVNATVYGPRIAAMAS